MRITAIALVTIALYGCGGDGDDDTEPTPPTGCVPGEWQRQDGACIAAGLPPDMPCPPGEWPREDGTCVPAGVPPDGCAQGFLHNGDRGCDAILPSEACPPGLMAIPGERTCREVAPCAAGTWGDIPVESNTEFVDASYPGTDSDGSALKPWTTIQAAVNDAASGAIVAIAEGSYLEDVTVSGKSVRLWGVCPELVEIVGTGSEPAALMVLGGAGATEVRSLAIGGDATCVASVGSLDVLLEHVWVHGCASWGVDIENAFGPTSIVVRGSLVEQNHDVAVFVAGSDATVEASVVRDTQPNAQGLFGRGLSAQDNPLTGAPASLQIRNSLVDHNHDSGVYVSSSEVTVEASVVRNTQTGAQGLFGRGVSVQPDPATATPASIVIRTSLVEQNHEAGVSVLGAQASIEASVVRSTQPNAQGLLGHGVNVQPDPPTGASATLLLHTSLVERAHELAVFVSASEATIEACAVRDTQPPAQGIGGRGVNVQDRPASGAPGLVMRNSVVERNYDIGVYVAGSDATIEASVIRDTLPRAQGLFGHGVHLQENPISGAQGTLKLGASLIERSHEVAVVVADSPATIESCIIRDTVPNAAAGQFGDGVSVVSDPGAGSATIHATRIERSARAALAAHGAHAAIGGSVLTCQAFDLDSEVLFGKAAKLEDLGGNLCGCPEPTGPCRAVSANLQPPPPPETGPPNE